MNGLDFFFSPSPPPLDTSTGEDDDWGEFVDSSPKPNGFSADRDRAVSTPTRIESEKKNSQTQWVTPRGPVPLSVFGEAEEEEDGSGAPVSPFDQFSFDSFSGKRNGSVNTNPTVEISGLIANLYRENEPNEINGNEKEPGVSLESFSWNPLNLATERSEKTSNAVTSDPTSSDLRNDDDDVDEGWEFKTAESILDPSSKENGRNGSVVVQSTTDFDSSMWSSPSNFETGGSKRENGDDDDPWGNGGWEFKVAETIETKKDLANKESNGWGFGFGFEHGSEIETTTSYHSTPDKDLHKEENGSISFPSNTNVNPGGSSWAFNQPSLDTGKEKEENEVKPDKPKGVLPLSFFEDETLETSDSDNLVHEDNLVSVCDFSAREKTKAPSHTVSINDLISSLYSQVEEKNAANLLETSATVNGEDDSWKFQGPTKTITDSSIAEDGDDDFDSTWDFQGPSLPLKNSDVADEVDDDSWEFQGPTQPVKDNNTSREGDNGLWESKQSSVENEGGNRFSVPNGFGTSHEETVITIEPNDYRDVFHMLKTELYYLALSHLETLKEARDLAANSDEVAEAQKYEDEVKYLQNMLKNDVLIGEVNVESLQARSSGITELYKVLEEPKFRTVDSEYLLSERLLVAEKDWKSTVELLKHATLTLKVLNLGSYEQQTKYTSTWLVIARTCAQELQHAASIWKQVIQNDVQEEILSKPQGKSFILSVGEIYRVVKILKASTRLYKPWVLLSPTSSTVLAAVLDECVDWWLSSGLEEALQNSTNDSDYSAGHQLLESIKCIDEVDAFTLHACITSATSPTCCISGLNTEIVPGIETVEWNGEHYLVCLANLWANLISRDSPDLAGGHSLFAMS